MQRVLFLTLLEPLEKAYTGPNGLIYEICQFIRSSGADLTVRYLPQEGKGRVSDQLSLFALKHYPVGEDLSQYDRIFLYPDTLLPSIPTEMLPRCIVIAPDATSMARFSKYKVYEREEGLSAGVKKTYQSLFARRYLSLERSFIPRVLHYVVVGRSDRRWLRRSLPKEAWEKVVFLTHPLIPSALVDFDKVKLVPGQKKRFVFAGDMSYSYIGENIRLLAQAFSRKDEKPLEVLVVGGKNAWVHEELSKAPGLSSSYVKWVPDYQDICQIGCDVHCIPLLAGAGTKNRVLTALANGLEVITTPKGIENIDVRGVTHLYIKKKMTSFAAVMREAGEQRMDEGELSELIRERSQFRKQVGVAFSEGMDNLLS